MAEINDPNPPQDDVEQAYQASLTAARDRLAKAEANFSLKDLKNPSAPATSIQNTPQPPIPTPAPEPKPVSPLSDVTVTPAPPQPVPSPEQPTQPKSQPPKPRRMPSRLKPLISAVIVFFLVLGAFKAPIFYYQIKYQLANQKSATNITTSNIARTPTLTIPKINVTAPIIFSPSIDENAIQKSLESGVVHYGNTAKPGQAGNSVIFGHSSNDWDKPGNYKFIFVLLEKLAVGDTFSVDYNNTRYDYQIYERKIILATDVNVLQPTATPTSTLITCWPTGTSQKRLIVRGKQISPVPSATDEIAVNPVNQASKVLPGADSNNGVIGTVTTWIENIRSALKGETIQVNDINTK